MTASSSMRPVPDWTTWDSMSARERSWRPGRSGSTSSGSYTPASGTGTNRSHSRRWCSATLTTSSSSSSPCADAAQLGGPSQRELSSPKAMARTVRSMSFASRCLAVLSIALGGAVALCAPATAEPEGTGESAQSVIDGLKAEGYNVDINWLTGYDTEPLSVCTVSNINNPGDSDPSQGELTTVYVDVSCPNHPDD